VAGYRGGNPDSEKCVFHAIVNRVVLRPPVLTALDELPGVHLLLGVFLSLDDCGRLERREPFFGSERGWLAGRFSMRPSFFDGSTSKKSDSCGCAG
jgi:hypothetical protein